MSAASRRSSTVPGKGTYTAPVTDTPKKSDASGNGRAVSMTKAAAPTAGGTPPPKQVKWAALALLVSGAGALVTSLALFGLKHWLFTSAVKANNKLKTTDKNHKTAAQLHSAVNSYVTSQLVATVILVLALLLVARAVYRGRYWARWVVLGLWIVSTFTNTFAGFLSIIAVGSSAPAGFKIPSFVSAVAFVAAVVLTSMRPSVEYFNLTRPARPEGAPQRRGLFGGGRATRPPAPGRPAAASAPRDAPARPPPRRLRPPCTRPGPVPVEAAGQRRLGRHATGSTEKDFPELSPSGDQAGPPEMIGALELCEGCVNGRKREARKEKGGGGTLSFLRALYVR